jgi:tripartite-type tricarboxylate transporter receptor subunit TctC
MQTVNQSVRSEALKMLVQFGRDLIKVLVRRDLVAAFIWGMVVVPASGQTQSYPNGPIRLVIPFTAGGASDVAARLLAKELGPRLGQSIVPDNRPGASSSLGAEIVAHAAPDGYTLFFGTSILTTWALIPGSNVPVDPINDFAFVGKVARSDEIVVVTPKLKINDLQGLVNLMRADPGNVQFGSPGIGTQGHMGGELLKYLTKTDALHIPYKGESAALTDLLGGRLTFMLCTPALCASRIQDGSLKGLGTTAKERSSSAPTIPTVAEAGVPGMEVGPWWYLAAPKGTPGPIIDKLSSALNQVLGDEKFRSRLRALGLESEPGGTPAAVKAQLQAEANKWRPVIANAKITAQ